MNVNAWFLLVFPAFLPLASAAIPISPGLLPVEERILYEQALESKITAVIDDMLGPGLGIPAFEVPLSEWGGYGGFRGVFPGPVPPAAATKAWKK